MATNASKIDAAAEKAYADAAAKKSDGVEKAADEVNLDAIAAAVDQDTTNADPDTGAIAQAVAAAPSKADAASKDSAAKTPVAGKTNAKPITKKAGLKKTKPKKSAATAPSATKTKLTKKKDEIMEKAQTKTAEYSAQMKDGVADLQGKAKAVYGKGSEMAAEMGTFTKGNMEAMVQSGKIMASGMQDIGKTYVEDAKVAVETVTADVKEVAAVRSPTELVQLQTKIASRNFDATIAAVSKNTEAWIKLTNEAMAPLSNRMSVAMEKVRKAA
ncbi:MAG: phasin family protein [Pontixanthobacter sp.]